MCPFYSGRCVNFSKPSYCPATYTFHNGMYISGDRPHSIACGTCHLDIINMRLKAALRLAATTDAGTIRNIYDRTITR